MTNEEKARLQAIYNDAGRPAEERNAAGRALGELPTDKPSKPAPKPAPAPAAKSKSK